MLYFGGVNIKFKKDVVYYNQLEKCLTMSFVLNSKCIVRTVWYCWCDQHCYFVEKDSLIFCGWTECYAFICEIIFFKRELLHHTAAYMHTDPWDAIKIPQSSWKKHVVITVLHRYYFSECLTYLGSLFIGFSFAFHTFIYWMSLSPSCDLRQTLISLNCQLAGP